MAVTSSPLFVGTVLKVTDLPTRCCAAGLRTSRRARAVASVRRCFSSRSVTRITSMIGWRGARDSRQRPLASHGCMEMHHPLSFHLRAPG